MSRPNAFALAADIFDPPEHPYFGNPVGFCRDYLGFDPWSKQAEIMCAVAEHSRVAVRSSHGVGKTATAARVALWFLATRPNSKVVTTAPTFSQVERLLWPAIRSSVSVARGRSPGVFPEPNKTSLEMADEWFAIGLSTNEPERFQGYHAPYLLLIVDEASGVGEGIYEASEGFTTAEGAHVLLIGNPTKVGGQFHRAFTTERDQWHCIHLSTEHTPNYTGERVAANIARSLPRKAWASEKAKQWGVQSPIYQVRVLGNFPEHAANAVISLTAVEAAQARVLEPDKAKDLAVIGCDVARFGDDDTVIAIRLGDQVRVIEAYSSVPKGQHPTVYTARRLLHHLRTFQPAAVRVVVDDTGVGGGVTDVLRTDLAADLHYCTVPVTAFNGAERAFQPDSYKNRRSEHWFAMQDRVGELDLDPDDQLAADLTSPIYGFDNSGRRVVEPKEETKKRLGRSPDRGDAVLLTLVPRGHGDVLTEPVGQHDEPGADNDEWVSSGFNPATDAW